jgi:predicted RNase H-like HicB family nuclease
MHSSVLARSDVLTQADSVEEAFVMARDAIAIWKSIRSEQRKNGGQKKPASRRKETNGEVSFSAIS